MLMVTTQTGTQDVTHPGFGSETGFARGFCSLGS